MGGIAPAQDLGDGLEVELLQLSLGDKDKGSTTVGQGRSVGGSDGTIFGLERWSECAGFRLVELRARLAACSLDLS